MPDKREVADRFFSCHTDLSTHEIAKMYGVVPEAVLNWEKRVAPPWKTLKYFCDSQGISWDWILDGVGSIYHPAKTKRKPRTKKPEFSTYLINRRFFTLVKGKKNSDIAAEFDVFPSTISEWKHRKNRVPWKKLQQAVQKYNVRWDWLLDGIEPKYRDSEESQ